MSDIADKKDSFFTEEEDRILKKNMKVREDVVDYLTDNGQTVPDKSGDIRVLKEVIESMDKKVIDIAKIRAQQEATKAVGGLTATIAQALKEAASVKEKGLGMTIDAEIDDELIPDDVVPGEMDIDADELTLEEFQKPIDGE